MANRTAKCAFAIFASVVAGTPVTIVASSPARAVDDCLTEPQGQAPQGQHWFYRTEHTTKQRCWYLRDTSEKAAQADASADAAAPAQSNEPATSLSATDAYAELPSPRPRADQNGGVSTTRRATANTSTAANAKDNATSRAAAANDSVFGPPPALSGSPETLGVNSSADPTPDTPAAQDTSTTPEATPVPTSPAAATPAQKEAGSLQMLLLVIFGALTLAGLSGSLVYRLGRARQTAQAAKRRREIWRSADIARRRAAAGTDRQPKNLAAARADLTHRRDTPRAHSRAGGVDDRRTAAIDAGGMGDNVERVEAFLSQLSKLAESDARSRPSR